MDSTNVLAKVDHQVRGIHQAGNYFDLLGVRSIVGQPFTPEVLARALFGNGNPLGRSIRFTQDKSARPFEIVGVVRDSRYYEIHGAPQPAVWFTFQDAAPYMPTLYVRSIRVSSDAMAAAVRRELNDLDKGFPIFNVKTLEVGSEESLVRERILANLSGAVGFVALALAAVGLYGILAYSVRGELGSSVSGWPSAPVPAPYSEGRRGRRFS